MYVNYRTNGSNLSSIWLQFFKGCRGQSILVQPLHNLDQRKDLFCLSLCEQIYGFISTLCWGGRSWANAEMMVVLRSKVNKQSSTGAQARPGKFDHSSSQNKGKIDSHIYLSDLYANYHRYIFQGTQFVQKCVLLELQLFFAAY